MLRLIRLRTGIGLHTAVPRISMIYNVLRINHDLSDFAMHTCSYSDLRLVYSSSYGIFTKVYTCKIVGHWSSLLYILRPKKYRYPL